MFAMFIQTSTGLEWVANYDTVEEAHEEMDREDCEAVFIVPLAEFKQFD